LEDGTFFMSWDVPNTPAWRRLGKLRLELTAYPKAHAPFAPFSSRDASLPPQFGVQANWPDALALAKGSEKLYAALRDRDGTVVAQTSVDPVSIRRGDEKIESAMTEMAKVASDFRNLCQHVSDTNPEIIVT
jgi:hypothetical protein